MHLLSADTVQASTSLYTTLTLTFDQMDLKIGMLVIPALPWTTFTAIMAFLCPIHNFRVRSLTGQTDGQDLCCALLGDLHNNNLVALFSMDVNTVREVSRSSPVSSTRQNVREILCSQLEHVTRNNKPFASVCRPGRCPEILKFVLKCPEIVVRS